MNESLEQARRRVDTSDMLARVIDFPRQMEAAWAIGAAFADELAPAAFSRIVVAGMGGSAIGGDMARAFLGPRLRVPVISCRDYALPAYASADTLVVVSSYSGNTAETLAAMEAARSAGCTMVAITSGGEVAARCAADGVPVCTIPGGMPPRSALGYSLLPLLHVLRKLGAAEFGDEEYDEALASARRQCTDCAPDSADNPAYALASSIAGRVPFVYAASGLLEGVARRWACQFNENSKMLAHWGTFPELAHNEIVGWEATKDLMRDAAVLALADPDDPAATVRQMSASLDIIEPLAGAVVRVAPAAGGRLARMFAHTLLGDFASVYLAYHNGVDPTPVEKIDRLKKQVGRQSGS